jgi:3-oxoacyl-[acyl-carrier protein] reductase
MAGRLNGKVILITGSSKGIGQGLAEGMGAEGAVIAVNYKTDREGAETTRRRILENGGHAEIFPGDVADKRGIEGLIEAVCEKFGRLDVLVNNAARTRFGALLNVTEEDYDDVFDTNVRGPFFGSIAAARRMLEQGSGCIINITSCAALLIIPAHSTYSPSKAALEGMTRQLAIDLAPKIRVNAISPAPTSTDRNRAYDPDYDAKWASAIPAGRVAFTKDYVGPCVFLASDESMFMTGQILAVDGGWSIIGHTPDMSGNDFSRDYVAG